MTAIHKHNERPTLAALMRGSDMQAEIRRALPKHLNPDRMARIVLSALRTTPKLADVEPFSFLACVLQASQLGLEPNTHLGLCYLIPRNSKKRNALECTFMLGYQGMIELASRSGRVSSIQAQVVKDGDEFDYSFGLVPTLRHVPSRDRKRDQARTTHAYAVARVGNDAIFEVITRSQIEARRDRGAGGPAWSTDFDAMARKSACRALWPWIPKSPEMAAAVAMEVAGENDRTLSDVIDTDVVAAIERQGFEALPDVEPESSIVTTLQEEKPDWRLNLKTGLPVAITEDDEASRLMASLREVDPDAVDRLLVRAPDSTMLVAELRKMKGTLDAARGNVGKD